MVRNGYELKLIRESGRIAKAALKKAVDSAKAGVTSLELDNIATQEIYRLGGDLSYKTVPGYKFATCVTVNDAVVHGVPTSTKLVQGDLVSVDLAVEFRGWHTDCAWSVLVEDGKSRIDDREAKLEFLRVGEQALQEGIAQAVEGRRVGDISSAIQTRVEGAGYSIVRALVGHGIGKKLHEAPEIPGYGKAGTGAILKTGMALAIEVIYAKGTSGVVLQPDGWTYSSEDGSWGGLFEMTVIVGKGKAEVLTGIGL